jgi:hypothetical protein
MDAATLLKYHAEHAWPREMTVPAEELPRFGLTTSNDDVSWFESRNEWPDRRMA